MDPDSVLASQHEALESLLQMPVAELARRLGVDPARLEAVFDRVARQTRAQADTSLLSLGVTLLPHVRLALLEAFAHLPAETALQLFEEEDLLELVGRWGLVHAILDDPAFLTILELADILDECAVHLERNRSSLVTMGVPRTTLGSSWPGMLLQYLYPTGFIYQEKQAVIDDAGRASPRHDALKHLSVTARATRVHTYLFDRVVADTGTSTVEPSTIDQSLLQWGPYEQVGRYPDLKEETASRIEAGRSRFLDLQIAVLRVLAKELRRPGNAANLWSQSLTLLTEALPADDVAFYLEIDQWCYGYDIASGEGQGDGAINLFPGGLSQLLMVLGHCEKERTIGTMHHTKRLMPPAVFEDASFRSYFQAIGQSWHQNLDRALDHFAELDSHEAAFWTDFRDRVNKAIETELKVEFRFPAQISRGLAEQVQFRPFIQSIIDLQQAHLHAMGTLAPLSLGVGALDSLVSSTRTIRTNGIVRTFLFDSDSVSLPDSMGLKYLTHLLLNPRREIHVSELISVVDHAGQSPSPPFAEGTGPAMDPNYKKHVRVEVDRLIDQLDEAREFDNYEEIERITGDIERYEHAFKSATGLRGKDRPTNSDAERARNKISKQLNQSIEKIGNFHPELGLHLTYIRPSGMCWTYEPPSHQSPWKRIEKQIPGSQGKILSQRELDLPAFIGRGR